MSGKQRVNIARLSVRAFLDKRSSVTEEGKQLRQVEERRDYEAKQRRIATELHAVADMKHRYIEPPNGKKKKVIGDNDKFLPH